MSTDDGLQPKQACTLNPSSPAHPDEVGYQLPSFISSTLLGEMRKTCHIWQCRLLHYIRQFTRISGLYMFHAFPATLFFKDGLHSMPASNFKAIIWMGRTVTTTKRPSRLLYTEVQIKSIRYISNCQLNELSQKLSSLLTDEFRSKEVLSSQQLQTCAIHKTFSLVPPYA